jgi:hypothetical protein
MAQKAILTLREREGTLNLLRRELGRSTPEAKERSEEHAYI